jgi:hypothetical protein
VPHKVHQVGGILAVMNGEAGVDPDGIGVHPQEPRADGVKRAGPKQEALACRIRGARYQALRPSFHLSSRASREGQ